MKDKFRVLGVDASTKSFAWSIVNQDGVVESYGEIFFRETGHSKRLHDTRIQMEALLPHLGEIDYIGFEQAVMVRNNNTVIKMAETFGVIKSVIWSPNVTLIEATPLAWQSWLGNPSITGKKKYELLEKHPELKNKNQEAAFIRKHRKQITMKEVEKRTGVVTESDNVSDAIAISLFILHKLKEIQDKDKI